MSPTAERINAAVAYIPVLGWLYVLIFTDRNPFVMFHMKQSIGLTLFILASFAGWIALTWVLSWIPFGFLFGVVFFTVVIFALGTALVALIMGVTNALSGKVAFLPIFGATAHRMKI